jgi:hypothetical protein
MASNSKWQQQMTDSLKKDFSKALEIHGVFAENAKETDCPYVLDITIDDSLMKCSNDSIKTWTYALSIKSELAFKGQIILKKAYDVSVSNNDLSELQYNIHKAFSMEFYQFFNDLYLKSFAENTSSDSISDSNQLVFACITYDAMKKPLATFSKSNKIQYFAYHMKYNESLRERFLDEKLLDISRMSGESQEQFEERRDDIEEYIDDSLDETISESKSVLSTENDMKIVHLRHYFIAIGGGWVFDDMKHSWSISRYPFKGNNIGITKNVQGFSLRAETGINMSSFLFNRKSSLSFVELPQPLISYQFYRMNGMAKVDSAKEYESTDALIGNELSLILREFVNFTSHFGMYTEIGVGILLSNGEYITETETYNGQLRNLTFLLDKSHANMAFYPMGGGFHFSFRPSIGSRYIIKHYIDSGKLLAGIRFTMANHSDSDYGSFWRAAHVNLSAQFNF